MFTGLVAERGRLIADPVDSGKGGQVLRLGFGRELAESLSIGSSLAVSGVCLTVVERKIVADGRGECVVELSPETLERTTLGGLNRGDEVNLEPSLRLGDALGGHIVQGHVDATTAMTSRRDLRDHRVIGFALPSELAPYVVEKGSIAIDGVSLTVAALAESELEIAVIPHTLDVTTLERLVPGDRVNLEVDVLAKYVARSIQPWLERYAQR